MKKAVVCFLTLLCPLCAENLFDNSTMDSTGGWKGDKKFVKEGAAGKTPKKPAKEEADNKEMLNRVLQLTAKLRGQVSFSQEVPTKGLTDLLVKFRYRTKDYIGRGLMLRGLRPNGGSTYTSRPLVSDGEWHEMTWEFDQVDGSNKIEFVFMALEGTGDIYFDDITVEAPKK